MSIDQKIASGNLSSFAPGEFATLTEGQKAAFQTAQTARIQDEYKAKMAKLSRQPARRGDNRPISDDRWEDLGNAPRRSRW